MEADSEDLTKSKQAIDDYVLYLGGLILDTESMRYQCARRGDLRGAMEYGNLVRDLTRYRDAVTTTHSRDMVIPPNVAKWLQKKLSKG